ncbi:MAG TPA: arginine deiminase-related protein [Stellaceae bacterium]|nr:arginine deiminase-related protein [Stellaceae bacterium]
MKNAPRILMCRPSHFGVTYAINPWMDPKSWASEAKSLATEARREWRALHARLMELGAEIALVPPEAGLPDLVFTANAAVVMDGKALLARFRHPERQGEEPVFRRAFDALKAKGAIDEVLELPEGVFLEGAGDCVFDATRQLYWMGYGPRSSESARPHVETMLGVETVALRLADPRFYHMDTALNPLTRGELIYVPEAFAEEGLAEIHARVKPELRIPVEPEDAAHLAANAVCIGDAVVMSRCGEGLRRRLEAKGYRVVETSLAAFGRSGGSAFCLTLRLDLRSQPVAAQEARRTEAFAAA